MTDTEAPEARGAVHSGFGMFGVLVGLGVQALRSPGLREFRI